MATSPTVSDVQVISTLLIAAEVIARIAHHGQIDRVCEPYIDHVKRVMQSVDTDDEKMVAWLHDVVEDSPITTLALLSAGIPLRVVQSVELLTRRKPYDYDQYIQRLIDASDRVALRVKLADLNDHLRGWCPESLRPRYEWARERVSAAIAKADHP